MNLSYNAGDLLRNFYRQQNSQRNAFMQTHGIQGPVNMDTITKLSNPNLNPSNFQSGGIVSSAQRAANNSGWTPSAGASAATTIPKTSATSTAAGAKAGGFFKNLKGKAATGWSNVKSGKGLMPEYSKYANIGSGIMQGLEAANNLSAYSNAAGSTDKLMSDIAISAMGNPNLRYDLTSEQLALLNQVQDGSYADAAALDMDALLGAAPNALLQAGLGFLSGGTTGAVINGIGTLANAGLAGGTAAQEQKNAELNALYQALLESEMYNKSLKRDAAMQRYANSLY